MSSPKILLTGATGFIGGSILSHLLKSDHPALKTATITCLVRGEDRVSKLNSLYRGRVKAELYNDLDDTERTIQVASEHNIVINTTLGYHPESAAALVRGLAKRKQATGEAVYMIHTSGTSNLADQPITKAYVESEPERVFDDSKDDIYGYEKAREARDPYAQRTSELGVIDTGLETGVKTLVIMNPMIYGVGMGGWNKSSIQVPAYVKATLSNGQAVVIGDGKGIWDHVHIEDLAELYTLALLDIVEQGGKDLPFGKEGIIFSEAGRYSWLEAAQEAADAAYEAGKIKTKEVKSVSLEEGAKLLSGGEKVIAELGMSSNARTRGVIARKLGWQPSRGHEVWKKAFHEEVNQAIAK